MNPLFQIRISLKALMRNKLRSSLAMLGVVIGVTAVIFIVSLGEAANAMVQEQIAGMGANRIMVMPGSAKTGGFHGGQGSVQTLTIEDFDAVMRECPSIAYGTPSVTSRVQIVRGNQNWSTPMGGSNEQFTKVRDWEVARGRFYTGADDRSGNKVCVVGQTIVDNLFGSEDPLGQTVRIKHLPFTVVGVLAKKGQAPWGGDFDDVVMAPLRTVQHRVLSITYLHNIQLSAVSLELMQQAQDEVEALLKRRHRIGPSDDADFMIRNQKDIADAASTVGNILTGLLAAIAGISLLVGGIGVMNIMLVSVTERTREIGIRMAIGARGRDILSQFLAEAVCLTGTGGIIGILLAYAAAETFKTFYPWPVRVAPWAAALSFLFSASVGVAFGLYPAWRASRMDPVDALRQV